MRKALNAWTVDSSVGFEEMFVQLKQAGFDGVELNVDEEGHSSHSLTLKTTDDELAQIKALSEKYELPVVSISTSMLGGYRMGAPDEDDRNLAKEIIRGQIRCAKALSAPSILIVPGGVPQQKSFVKAYELSMQTLVDLKPEIEAAKIYTGVENVWNGFFMSPFDMANFVDKADSPYIRAYFDVGNVLAFSWPEFWIEALGSRIQNIHVKDFKRGSVSYGGLNTGGTWEDLTEGSADWAAIMPTLQAIGYDGYITAEVFKADENQSHTDYYKKVADALAKIISLGA